MISSRQWAKNLIKDNRYELIFYWNQSKKVNRNEISLNYSLFTTWSAEIKFRNPQGQLNCINYKVFLDCLFQPVGINRQPKQNGQLRGTIYSIKSLH